MAELDELYSARILELAAAISRNGRLAAPGASATAHSKLCGSTVTVDVTLKDGRVTDYAHTVKACLLGQAACAVVAREIVGATAEDVRAAGAQMRAMLKAGGSAPAGHWADLAVLEPVKAHKGRHASVLLVFDAVETCITTIEAAAEAAVR
ncbi:MAG: iron-sulfur cluster assembly scaffold protein [Hyphomicrobiaceae bacterium]|nr:iron-sulfur cluster assembly scaffold protein [Hyphomicrobiaceae bacterium]